MSEPILQNVNFDEAKQSQLAFVELLVNMGYAYISADEVLRQRGGNTTNFLLSDIAAQKLMDINGYEVDNEIYKFSEKDVRDAIDELEHMQYKGLIETAQEIYNMIMPTSGGKTIKINHGGKQMSKNFRFIDFEHVENNSFHVTVEYPASGKQNIRPDIVCFVNGIPFAVIENKKSGVELGDALKQMVGNQEPEKCPRLYTYAQLLIVSNVSELQYGTTGTKTKFYATWKEKGKNPEEDKIIKEKFDEKVQKFLGKPIDTDIYIQILRDLNGYTVGYKQIAKREITEQDRGIVSLLEPHRLLDLTKNYILFDAGAKKLARYQQYFAISKMLKCIEEKETTEQGITRRKGGLVWHTQGSGKSLTMVMFVKALIEDPNIQNPRIIIVTDRKDLDKQIKDTFHDCGLKKDVTQAKSGEDLWKLIQSKDLRVITTLVHKFEKISKKKTSFVDTDENLFVLIDEAHRSQYGDTASRMREVLKNACFIGFTGTPLLKNDKSESMFKRTIDKYTIDDALADKVILPLIYEGRYIEMELHPDQIDRHIDRITDDMLSKHNESVRDSKRMQKLQKHITADVIKNNPQRIVQIARDIEKHFVETFQNTGLKAQIVAPSKFSAVLFQKFFEEKMLVRTAVVISDENDDGDESDTHKKEVTDYLAKIRNNQSIENYEKTTIQSFKHNPDGIEIIIVVSKLLTGFDAPCNTVLYLTKDLHDHELLQAIARVNRLFENNKEPKTAGYIIDYSENAKNIQSAMQLFGNYDEQDVKSVLIDVDQKVQELEMSYAKIHDLFNALKGTRDSEAYMVFLGDDARRKVFHESMKVFIRNFDECFVLQDFVHAFPHLDTYRQELKKFLELRKAVNVRYAENIDLSEYKLSLVKILDQYVDAHEAELLTTQINITDRKQFEEAVENLGSDKSKAEAIAAQTVKTITENKDKDPEFYERFSKKISEIIEKMRQGKLADIEALKELKMIRDHVIDKKDEELPKLIEENKGSDVLYRNLRNLFAKHDLGEGVYVQVVLDIFTILHREAIVDWYKNIDVKRKMTNILDDYLYDVARGEMGISLENDEIPEIISTVMRLAENNFEIFS